MSSGSVRSHRILTNLLVWISASLLVVGIAMVAINTLVLSIPIKHQIDQQARDVCSELVDRLSEDVWNMDERTIRQHFVGYPRGSLGLASVEVRTEFEDLLFERTFSEEVNPICNRTAVIRDGRTVGYVEVRLNRSHLLATQRALARSGVTLITLAILIILVVCTLIVNIVVIRPVKRTVAGLRTIAAGDYQHELPMVKTAEISAIHKEINSMASEISKRQRLLERAVATRERAESGLRDLNHSLEKRIDERTLQLRRLAKMLAAAQDVEQKRIAEGLHDDVAQLLTASRMKITVALAQVETDKCKAALNDIGHLVTQAYERVRLLSFELASSTLYRWGLKDSLMKLCAGMNERYDASFELIGADDLENFNETSAMVLFKAAREILFNVIKHSGVKRATVTLRRLGDELSLIVEDEGKGFDCELAGDAGRGLGLFSVKERLRDIDGEIIIESEPGVSTRVLLRVPWVEKDARE